MPLPLNTYLRFVSAGHTPTSADDDYYYYYYYYHCRCCCFDDDRMMIMATVMNVSKKCNRNLFLKCGLKRCREISFGRFYFSTLFAFQHREAQQLCGTGLLFFSLNILYKGRFLSVSVLAIFTIPVNFGFLCQATEQLSSFSCFCSNFYDGCVLIRFSKVPYFAFLCHHSRISHFPHF